MLCFVFAVEQDEMVTSFREVYYWFFFDVVMLRDHCHWWQAKNVRLELKFNKMEELTKTIKFYWISEGGETRSVRAESTSPE